MTPSGTTHFIHDFAGNVIAETAGGGATGATGTVREYIWLPEGEITPTFRARAQVDRPLAVVNAVNATPVTWYVHVDHLNQPIKMTDGAKASVWDAVWQAFFAPILGFAMLNRSASSTTRASRGMREAGRRTTSIWTGEQYTRTASAVRLLEVPGE